MGVARRGVVCVAGEPRRGNSKSGFVGVVCIAGEAIARVGVVCVAGARH